MSNYMYKTTAPAVVAAVIAWETKRKEWDAQRAKLGQVFGGAASPMRSGNRSYVGGVKISDSRELDVHWCRPDQYDMDEAWEAIGLNPGALWMCGGVFFELDGVVFLSLGLRLEDGNEEIESAAEILGSEFEAARQQVFGQRQAA